MLNLDLSELDFENIGYWPMPVKMGAIILAVLLIFAIGIMFDTQHQSSQLNMTKRKEVTLRKELEDKQQMAVNLTAYKEQLSKIRHMFSRLLLQLPSKTEVPGLLEDISKAGIASGLEFKLFDPLEPVQHDFYSELPIKIAVVGNYHQLGRFISQVAKLNRIVSLHDFEIKPIKDKEQNTKDNEFGDLAKLRMDIVAKIYRYTDTQDNNKITSVAKQGQNNG